MRYDNTMLLRGEDTGKENLRANIIRCGKLDTLRRRIKTLPQQNETTTRR